LKDLTRPEQLSRLRQRYAHRGRAGKSRLLDELCEQFGYSRKHAIKLMRPTSPAATGRRHGPPPRYQPIQEVMERIWSLAEQLCGKRLVQALPLWLPHYPKHFGRLLPCQQRLLREVSSATLDRLLVRQRAPRPQGLSGTKPGRLLRLHVPLQGEVWNTPVPGFLEADSVVRSPVKVSSGSGNLFPVVGAKRRWSVGL